MKKSKIKMLTASACLAIVGTASAAWVYAGTATASANIGVKVASYASAGTITISDTSDIKIVLDKGSVYYLDGNDKVTATYAAPTDGTGTELTYDTTNNELGLYYMLTISDGLRDYIQFKDTTTVTGASGEIYYAGTWESGTPIALPELIWKTVDGNSKCPSDFDGYKELLNDATQASESENTGNLDAKESWNMKIELSAEIHSKQG